jgi:hypothetical protein
MAALGAPPWIDVAAGIGFQNSWVNFGSPFALAAYSCDAFGIVRLRGVVKAGTVGAVMFTLPAGFLPLSKLIFAADSNSAHGKVTIDSAGNVMLAAGSNVNASLSGISFATN